MKPIVYGLAAGIVGVLVTLSAWHPARKPKPKGGKKR